jgi:transglutaminase-like putative cysteine protease
MAGRRGKLRGLRPCPLAATALLVSLASASARGGDPTFRVAPAPPWVKPVDAEIEAAVPEGAARDGVHELLSDQEVRVSRAGVAAYFHVARKIVGESGVEPASELHFDFDPPYEQLLLHHIRIVRGGRAADALRPGEIHVIQQEGDLSQRVYNGTLTAVAFLHDVRAGDVIDYAYSLVGQNPVLGERFSQSLRFARDAPVRRLRVRLATPPDRPLKITLRGGARQPEEHSDALGHEYLWDLRDVPAARIEDETPRWFNPLPRAQATEYASFGEVAAWAVPLYEAPARPSSALDAQIESLRRAAPDEAGRMLAALRFVQREVRYLGIELGPHSHEPQPPATVLDRRFGDCKDKTLLLVTLLRGLGIEARAALVNTDLRRGLDEVAPSPLVFNHAIVRARSGGHEYWLDPTLSTQRGDLETLPVPGYERALVVAPDTTGLVPMPPHELAAPSVEEIEDLDAHDYAAPALLRVKTTYRGAAADAVRSDLATTDRAELSRRYLNYYAHEEPSIAEAAPPEIVDDEAHATLTVTESYRIPGFWQEEKKYFHVRLIEKELLSPSVALRTMPLRVKHPTSLVHQMRLTLPGQDLLDIGVTDLADESTSLRCRTSAMAHVATINCTFKTLRDFVPASAAAEHLRLLGKMRDALSYSFTRPEPSAARGEDSVGVGIIVTLTSAIALLFAVPFVRRLPRILKKRAFARRFFLAGGEAPATALPVPSLDELQRRVLKSKCGCGARPSGVEELDMGQLRLGSRAITSARIACASCGQTRTTFFEVQG